MASAMCENSGADGLKKDTTSGRNDSSASEASDSNTKIQIKTENLEEDESVPTPIILKHKPVSDMGSQNPYMSVPANGSFEPFTKGSLPECISGSDQWQSFKKAMQMGDERKTEVAGKDIDGEISARNSQDPLSSTSNHRVKGHEEIEWPLDFLRRSSKSKMTAGPTADNEKPYSCTVCTGTFKNQSELTRHMRTHTGEKPYTCTDCGKAFAQSANLKQHMMSHTGEKPFKCLLCPKTYSQRRSLTDHMKSHTGERPFTCSVCGKTFMHSSGLTIHMRIHTGEKPFSCKDCDKSFRQIQGLYEHLRTHNGEKPYVCSVCSKAFNRSSNLTLHMRAHTGEKPFPCTICEKSFIQRSALTEHMRVHSGEKPFTCNVCNKSFSQSSNLNVHMKSHTGDKPHACTLCDKSFTIAGNLAAHMKTHSGEKDYTCPVCNRSFGQRPSLTVHMRTHSGEKPFTCSVCGKSFSQSSGLTFHMRTHTGEKPFKCNQCEKSFSQPANLQSHMRSHTGERPFMCEICSKAFSQRTGLTDHMRTHSGERPFSCPVCNKAFSQSSSLTRHIKSHLGEKPAGSSDSANQTEVLDGLAIVGSGRPSAGKKKIRKYTRTKSSSDITLMRNGAVVELTVTDSDGETNDLDELPLHGHDADDEMLQRLTDAEKSCNTRKTTDNQTVRGNKDLNQKMVTDSSMDNEGVAGAEVNHNEPTEAKCDTSVPTTKALTNNQEIDSKQHALSNPECTISNKTTHLPEKSSLNEDVSSEENDFGNQTAVRSTKAPPAVSDSRCGNSSVGSEARDFVHPEEMEHTLGQLLVNPPSRVKSKIEDSLTIDPMYVPSQVQMKDELFVSTLPSASMSQPASGHMSLVNQSAIITSDVDRSRVTYCTSVPQSGHDGLSDQMKLRNSTSAGHPNNIPPLSHVSDFTANRETFGPPTNNATYHKETFNQRDYSNFYPPVRDHSFLQTPVYHSGVRHSAENQSNNNSPFGHNNFTG